MDDVDKVFAEIKARALTSAEISERSGISLVKVEKILCLLTDFEFATKDGMRFRAAKEWAALRLGTG
jgi:DNA-binding IclR family transcriptional regulator